MIAAHERTEMKKILFVFLFLLFPSIGFTQPMSQPDLYPLPIALTSNMTRACAFQPGAATAISCTTASSASSGALNSWSRYVIQCADNTYLRWGVAAISSTSADLYVPAGVWLEFITTDTLKFVACLNISSSVGCKILECK
jgi:hypothetical protein